MPAFIAVVSTIMLAIVVLVMVMQGPHQEAIEEQHRGGGVYCFTIRHHPDALSCIYAPERGR
jgi:hypothetical protein